MASHNSSTSSRQKRFSLATAAAVLATATPVSPLRLDHSAFSCQFQSRSLPQTTTWSSEDPRVFEQKWSPTSIPTHSRPFVLPQHMIPKRDKWRRTPLHRAAKEGHKDVVAALLDSGAEINAKVRHTITASAGIVSDCCFSVGVPSCFFLSRSARKMAFDSCWRRREDS